MNTEDRYFTSVLVSDERQIKDTGAYAGIGRVYLGWHMDPGGDSAAALKEAGAEIYTALPHIVREDRLDKTRSLIDRALSCGVRGFLVRNFEELVLVREKGVPFITDSCMYTFNKLSAEFLREQGASELTAPVELNRHELFERGLKGTELTVYGRIPLMVTAQCVKKTEGLCGKPGDAVITDRYRNSFKVAAFCDYCYNLVWNSRPLYLMDCFSEVDSLAPASLRIELTDEGPEDAASLTASLKAFSRGEDIPFAGQFTRGHFNRGVL